MTALEMLIAEMRAEANGTDDQRLMVIEWADRLAALSQSQQALIEKWREKAENLTAKEFGYAVGPEGWHERAGTLEACADELAAALTQADPGQTP